MSRTRIYLPGAFADLAELVGGGRLGAGGTTPAHAVTDRLRAELPDADEEELEYLAMTAAAQASLRMVADPGPFARLVVAADATEVVDTQTDDPTSVGVPGGLSLSGVVAVHVDEAEAAEDVRGARAAFAEDRADAPALAERCLDHELAWYASQEIGDLLDRRRP